MAYLIAPFIWGLLEAALLFMVPDVAISYVTLKHGAKKGAYAAMIAAIGAAIGGIFMFYWGANNLPQILGLIEKLPAISQAMIEKVNIQMHGDTPFIEMLNGSMTGTPYKIYASFASSAGINPISLFLLTPLVRLPRFLIVVLITKIANAATSKIVFSSKAKTLILFSAWALFYALYWTFMPS